MIPETIAATLGRLTREDSEVAFRTSVAYEALSYRRLRELVAGNAERFRACGITAGTPVAICLANDLESVTAFLALLGMGAVPVSLKPRRGPADAYAQAVTGLLDTYGIRYVYGGLPADWAMRVSWDPRATSSLTSVFRERAAEDLAFVQFSSGSLGAPKPVPITHGNLLANLRADVTIGERGAFSSAFGFLPLCHDMSLVGGLLTALVCEHTVMFVDPQYFLRRPLAYLQELAARHADVTAMPDFALRYLARYLLVSRNARLREPLLSSLRLVACGAEPIRLDTIASFLHAAEPLGFEPRALYFLYGLAEATLLVSGHEFQTLGQSFDQSLPGRSVARLGVPIGGTSVRIRSLESCEVITVDGTEGVVEISGPSVISGYWGEPPRADAWLDTGDIGYLVRGEIYISGRTKELLVVNGEKFFPVDLESAACGLTGVRDCLALLDGEDYHLLVVPNDASPPDVTAVAGEMISRFGLAPESVVFGSHADIEWNSSGKPMRAQTLRRLERSGRLHPRAAPRLAETSA